MVNYVLPQAWQRMHSRHLHRHLGIKHTPVGGLASTMVEGVWVWAEPLITGSPFQLRMKALCPTCDKTVPAGRLAQHHKVHKEA
jgi:hypothetical protein